MGEESKAKRVGIVSLGCAKNLVDSEVMLGDLQARGYEIVNDLEQADTVIVNTCGFIDEAKRESVDAILDVAARSAGTDKKLLVAGCMVNRFGEELANEIPEIDGFIDLDQLQEVPSLIQIGDRSPKMGAATAIFDHTAPRLLTTQGYAYLKVAEGCDNPCTFCAIPLWRGKFRSRTIDSLVEEARTLERAGRQEICLIAQDTTRYGEDLSLGKHGLARLVEALLRETEVPWIRFLYAYPTTLDEKLLHLMAAESRFLPYLDIPLQHSHPDLLRAMRRGGSGESYLRLLERARSIVPGISLRSTFIVGFPGETEEKFENLLQFVAEARFDHLGGFAYSPEPGTPAAELADLVDEEVAAERLGRLLETQRPISLESRGRLVGRTLPVLVEGVCEETEHLLQGRHAGQAPEIDGRVLINDGFAESGSIVEVEISEAHADDVVGGIVASQPISGMVAVEVEA